MDTSAAKSKQEQLKPRLPNFLAQLVAAGTEPRQKGPHLEMAASCHVYGLRDARSRCNHCGWLNSVWDAIGSSIQGNTRNEGHSCISCNKCQAVHEPTLTLRKRLPRAVIDRSHSELSISTVGDLSTQIHLLNLKVCLDRITSRQLDELTEEKLLEEDPEVYWCLHLFYGLRAEVFWRKGSDAPVLLASTGFHSMCRSLAAAKKQEAKRASLSGAAPAERSQARLPTAPRQAEEFSDLALKSSTRRNKSVERSVEFFEEEGPNGRAASRRPAMRRVTLKDIGEVCIVPQEDEDEEDSEESGVEKSGRRAAEGEVSFVHVNMEVRLEPLDLPEQRPLLTQRPRAPPELPQRRRRSPRRGVPSPRALKENSLSSSPHANEQSPSGRSVSRSPKTATATPVTQRSRPRRVQNPLVVARFRPKCRLQNGEGYAKDKHLRKVLPRRAADLVAAKGLLVAGGSLEEQLVSEIAGLSRRIDDLQQLMTKQSSPRRAGR
ncbi:unnamed protein product [Durusdinium trenchii]|uniref:Uncharacterized protein n=1 Tax=Durusdinium trenchii TaxID=1381693 RepID=A0ABP0IY58_9DINO